MASAALPLNEWTEAFGSETAHLAPRRLRFSDKPRRSLAAKARSLGRKELAGIATFVTPDTLLRWHGQGRLCGAVHRGDLDGRCRHGNAATGEKRPRRKGTDGALDGGARLARAGESNGDVSSSKDQSNTRGRSFHRRAKGDAARFMDFVGFRSGGNISGSW